MNMFILYVYENGSWQAVENFKDRRGYAELVKTSVETKLANGTETQKKAATVMADFVNGKKFFGIQYKKLVMRALRHFDEVGISNSVYEVMEEMSGEAFALAKDTDDVGLFVQGEFDFEI